MWEKTRDKKLVAGLLIKDLPFLISIKEKKKFASFPLCIILAPACDIDSYYKSISKWKKRGEIKDRQLITQIIFCPAFEEEIFTEGTHLKLQYDYDLPNLDPDEKVKIKSNQNMRYHYIKSDDEEVPNLFLDFKQYFTLPVKIPIQFLEITKDTLYKLGHWYYTQVSDRFAHYLQRVAIP